MRCTADHDDIVHFEIRIILQVEGVLWKMEKEREREGRRKIKRDREIKRSARGIRSTLDVRDISCDDVRGGSPRIISKAEKETSSAIYTRGFSSP